jgi:hypothetical protein
VSASTQRYARQIALREIGPEGQASLLSAEVRVEGRGPEAEVCALYLAGAGVGRLRVDPRWADASRAINSTIEVRAIEDGGPELALEVGATRYAPPPDASPLSRGAQAARWALLSVVLKP